MHEMGSTVVGCLWLRFHVSCLHDFPVFSDDVQSFMKQDKCTLLLVRAGIFMKPECLAALSSYLKAENENVKLIIFSHPSDFLPLNEFVTALNSFGKENVILDLPKTVMQKVQNLAGNSAFDRPSIKAHDEKSEAIQTSSYFFVRLYFMTLLLISKLH